MKLIVDNNLSPSLARSFQPLFDEHQFLSLRDKFPANTKDVDWIGNLDAEGGWADALALQPLRGHGDHVAPELGSVAEREAAQVGVGNCKQQDAVRRRSERFGELLQARRAGEPGVGKSRRGVQPEAGIAQLDRERRCQSRRSGKEKRDAKKPLYLRPRFAAIRMRNAFKRMNPAASA